MLISSQNFILISVLFSVVVCAEVTSRLTVNMSKVFANVNSDPPQPNDLKRYLLAIKGIMNCYVGDPEATMNQNTLFGIFLAKVNLKHALLRSDKMSSNMRIYVENIVDGAETLITLISEAIHFPEKFYMEDEIFLRKQNDFYPDLIPVIPTDIENILNTGPDLCVYLNETLFIPGSFWKQYGKCIAEMTKFERTHDYPINCSQQFTCDYNSILNATEAGYVLSHKVILLILTNYIVGCDITSDDKTLLKSLCDRAYIESIYIVGNNYVNLDLLMEFVTLCGLTGNSNFLRRDWLERTLELQQKDGHFINPVDEVSHRQCRRGKTNSIDPISYTHFTAVSLAGLATAIRFILEIGI
ncbi:uncharacterized protein LOC105386551 isoform X2 [Plutella xylostella]|uniref:uncharacterized protein LOC105386551 isoform X2 n=1 Tax=Plutella xylostella TaxID=51655 RepID=UPI002032D6C6|nr:uncharacterized protein LOC105386551 isoform X2 [Plutella xylostella]